MLFGVLQGGMITLMTTPYKFILKNFEVLGFLLTRQCVYQDTTKSSL